MSQCLAITPNWSPIVWGELKFRAKFRAKSLIRTSELAAHIGNHPLATLETRELNLIS